MDLGSSRHDLVPDPAALRGGFPGSWRSDHQRAERHPRTSGQAMPVRGDTLGPVVEGRRERQQYRSYVIMCRRLPARDKKVVDVFDFATGPIADDNIEQKAD